MMLKFLNWRRDNNVDEIRQNIVTGGFDSPSKFPKAELILRLIPQAVLCPFARDNNNAPISVEKFNFSPSEVLANITIPEYIHFLIYCLEYKALITEQLSEEADRAYLASLSPEEREKVESDPESPPYGTLTGLCIIRDLEGLGFDHVGSQGQTILKTVVNLASDNYPELLRKCFIINSPWIFNTIWYFARALMSERCVVPSSIAF